MTDGDLGNPQLGVAQIGFDRGLVDVGRGRGGLRKHGKRRKQERGKFHGLDLALLSRTRGAGFQPARRFRIGVGRGFEPACRIQSCPTYTGGLSKYWLFVPLLVVYLSSLGRVGFLGPDEPRYASIGREMAHSGDWVTPRLDGSPWFEKSPLLYWMTGAGHKLHLAFSE